jgi:chemotaxis protein histidine kinase CheA
MVKSPFQRAEETKYSDHSVIVPPHRLKSVIRHTPEPGHFAMDVVARAEAALAEIKHEFRAWMSSECDALEHARNAIHERGASGPTMHKLFHAAHDVKGHAAVLGFPLAGRIAGILCRLLTYAPNPELVPISVIDGHVDAIRAVVREKIHTTSDQTGKEIFERLAIIVESFLANELGDAYASIADDAPVAFDNPKLPDAPEHEAPRQAAATKPSV